MIFREKSGGQQDAIFWQRGVLPGSPGFVILPFFWRPWLFSPFCEFLSERVACAVSVWRR